MKIFLVVFTLIFSLFSSYSQNWTNHDVFPYNGVHHPITFSNDSLAFVVAGSYTNNVYKYNKLTNLWTQLDDFPGGNRGYAYGVSIDNKAYLGFGSDEFGNFYNDLWEYDMINDIWVQLSSLPGPGRNHPAMVVAGNKIFMGCGSNSSNLNDWWEYDIVNNTWSQKQDLPGNTRHHPFYFGIGDFAYVGFGHGSSPGPGTNPSNSLNIFNDFYKYDAVNGFWTQLSNFPSEARVAGTQFSYNGKGYILSGDGDDHTPLDNGEFWEYEPNLDLWTQLNPHPGDAIWAPGNFILGCDVYFLLGQNNNTTPSSFPNAIYKYRLSNDCGCTDSLAINYSPLANTDDGSCCYISGCTDPTAVNYDSNACFDDGSCMAPILGCTDSTAINYNPTANTLFAYGGELDNNFGSGGYFYNDQHLLLDVYEDCIIQSATFYAEVNNTITFELRDANGNVIDDTTHSVVPGPQQLVLNFDCPIGTDLQLGLSAGSNSGLYRNNSGPSYPYDIAGALSITESSAGVPGYYYFYYNIEVVSRCVLPLPSWDCINNSCVDPGDGSGQFSSLSSCELSCFAPSWDCINNSCVDPGDGSGQFSSLSSCELSCFAPSWDCINDTCIDPGDGSGQFSSLSSCELSCFAPSWDCINDTCIDPGDGSGQFSSLSSCELSCISTSLSEMNNDKFIIYPNPFNNTSTIYFSNDKLSDVQLLLFDITGRVVRVYNTNEDNITIERGALDQGIYYINLNIKDRKDQKATLIIY